MRAILAGRLCRVCYGCLMKMKSRSRLRRGPKQADDVDRHVGHRIRAQRLLLGMTQTEIAGRLGLTFQQLQKYEKGVNRVGAGRLSQLADILGVPVSYFYEELAAYPQAQSRKQPDVPMNRITAFLATKEGLLLMTSFLRIRNEEIRRSLIGHMVALAGSRADALLRSRIRREPNSGSAATAKD